jgi:hypothetical protein
VKIILTDSVEDRNIFKDLIKPHIRFNGHLTTLFRGLRQNNRFLVTDTLRVMCLQIVEVWGNYCTFKFSNFECHMEQIGNQLEIEINRI